MEVMVRVRVIVCESGGMVELWCVEVIVCSICDVWEWRLHVVPLQIARLLIRFFYFCMRTGVCVECADRYSAPSHIDTFIYIFLSFLISSLFLLLFFSFIIRVRLSIT